MFNVDAWRMQGRYRTAEGRRAHTAMDPETGATVLIVEAPETCQGCNQNRAIGFGPSHSGSPLCRCGSIASGGDVAHCTCSTCF